MECPKCKYARTADDTGPDYECPKCGIVYAKFDPDAAIREAAIGAKAATRKQVEKPKALVSKSAKVSGDADPGVAGPTLLEQVRAFMKTRKGRVTRWVLGVVLALALIRFAGMYGVGLLLLSPLVLTLVKKPNTAKMQITNCPACGGVVAYGVKSCPHCGKGKPAPTPGGQMVIALVSAFFGLIVVVNGQNPSGNSSSEKTKPQDDSSVRQDAQNAIRFAGYRCDSISFMGRLITKTGFRVTCNDDRYAYTITDEGGRMVIQLD